MDLGKYFNIFVWALILIALILFFVKNDIMFLISASLMFNVTLFLDVDKLNKRLIILEAKK